MDARDRLARPGRGVFKFHGKASVDGKLAAEADFAAMLVETG
jgi:3-hydroxymyristoyl/3-hydroxydecanoyl-(acyl carrier protein) dehydratase